MTRVSGPGSMSCGCLFAVTHHQPCLFAEPRRGRRAVADKREMLRQASQRRKYYMHAYNAALRGVSFLLSFDEWWEIWQQSGHWHERGPYRGQYVMARYADQGAYEIGNVQITEKEYATPASNKSPEARAARLGNQFARRVTRHTAEARASIKVCT